MTKNEMLPTENGGDSKSGSFVELYDNPIIRMLAQLIPGGIGSSVDVLLMSRIEKIHHDRAARFFMALRDGDIALTTAAVQSEEFVFKFECTMRAVLRTRRNEKIEALAKLFSFSGIDNRRVVDKYERACQIIEDLSHEEFLLLLKLKEFEMRTKPNSQFRNDRLRANEAFWPEFIKGTTTIMNCSESDIDGVLSRIERTGCIYNVKPQSNWYGGVSAITTSIFDEVIEYMSPIDSQLRAASTQNND